MSLLVALDFSDVSDRQLEVVGRLAHPDREIHLLHVAEPNPTFVGFEGGPDEVRAQIAKELHLAHERIQALAARLRGSGHRAASHLVRGPTIQTILEQAETLGAEMIIVGSHGRGKLFDLLMGNVSAGVIRKSKVPVLVVPSR
jgi:nucleotide-binding universal stress UspA family protein